MMKKICKDLLIRNSNNWEKILIWEKYNLNKYQTKIPTQKIPKNCKKILRHMRRNNIKTCIRRQRFKQIKIKEAFRIIPLKTETKGIGITFLRK